MKKIIFIFTLAVFLSLGLKLTFSAQNYAQGGPAVLNSGEGLAALEAKIDTLNNDFKSSHKEISRKLDQVLSNQEKIFQELAIIKVRASKK